VKETKEARLARKQEAKRLKRSRIEEAGGKRPRIDKPKPTVVPKKKPSAGGMSTHTNKNKNKRGGKDDKQHRFGRVMEHAPCPNESRMSTLSIAIPGSIISNAQTQELRTALVGQIARAAAIYHVDEIVVFNDRLAKNIRPHYMFNRRRNDNHDNNSNKDDADKDKQDDSEKKKEENKMRPSTDPHAFMARLLQYCECPQYLRRNFFPMHPDLQFAGLLAPLDAPHHVRALDRSEFREGVVLDKVGKEGGSLVYCGIRSQDVEIDRVLSAGIRCTVQIDPRAYTMPGKSFKGKVVSPSAPREKDGTYWGYTTRMASSIKAIFDEAPYSGGYDLKIGTSERGDTSVDDPSFGASGNDADAMSSFQHAIIVLGGVAGIEECVDADETMEISGNESKSLFDMWVNVCQFQGSRTIRTEEAVLICLSRLRPALFPDQVSNNGKKKKKSSTVLSQVEFSDGSMSDESE